jgi:hypothetical protein
MYALNMIFIASGGNYFSYRLRNVKASFERHSPRSNRRAVQQIMVRRTKPCKIARKLGQNVCPIGVARK